MQGRRHQHLPRRSGNPQNSEAGVDLLRRSDVQCAASATERQAPPRRGRARAATCASSAQSWSTAVELEMLPADAEQGFATGHPLPSQTDRAAGSRPEAVTPARLLVRAKSGSLVETAAWATEQKRGVADACRHRRVLPRDSARHVTSARRFGLRRDAYAGPKRPAAVGGAPAVVLPSISKVGANHRLLPLRCLHEASKRPCSRLATSGTKRLAFSPASS
jgi:hypothetical protein